MISAKTFHDRLVTPETPDLPAGFFDRFVFNLHPADAVAPSVLLGFGIYPPKDTADGFVVVSDGREQRNLRFAMVLSATGGDGGGPFRFTVDEPNASWSLRLSDNPIGVEFDVTWRARTRPWWGRVVVDNASDQQTSFDHLFQSGTYEGTLTIDGQRRCVDGWWGQRDRSRGVRTMSGGQGLHIWYQAQFPDFSIGFLLVETRTGGRILLEGAVMHTSGEVDDIVDARHALNIGENLDLIDGDVKVTTAAGREYLVHADACAGGGFMAGAGYGGHHGVPRGIDHVESDRYPLDGSVNPRTLDSALTDRLCTFDLGGVTGSGIFEYAFTRSESYTYRPTI